MHMLSKMPCAACGIKYAGRPALRPVEYSRISKRQKHVMRAYGRWLALRQVCAHAVRCRPAAQLTGYTALRLWSLKRTRLPARPCTARVSLAASPPDPALRERLL